MIRVTQLEIDLNTLNGVLILGNETEEEKMKVHITPEQSITFIKDCNNAGILGNKILINNQETVNYTIL